MQQHEIEYAGQVVIDSQVEEVSRRDFLKAASAGIFVISEMSVIRLLHTAGSIVSEPFPAVYESVRPYPHAGWLETQYPNRPAFINADNGHADYLKHLCTQDEVSKVAGVPKIALGIAYRRFKEKMHVTTPPLLGGALKEHFDCAYEALKQVKHAEPHLADCVHIGLMTFAMMYSPYFTYKEIKDLFDVDLEVKLKRRKVQFFHDIENRAPRLFPIPVKPDDTEFMKQGLRYGGDRAVHFAQHAFVAYQYIYADNYFLQDKDRVPRGLKWVLDLMETFGETPEGRARFVSGLAGLVNEALETVKYLKREGPVNAHGEALPFGLLEDKDAVTSDFKANGLGTNIGVNLAQKGRGITQQDIDNVVEELNEPKYNIVSDGVK